MRRVVREYVAACIARTKPHLECYIAEHLRYPDPFPYTLVEPIVSIREIRQLKLAPRFRADYPPLDIIVTMRVSLAAKTQKRNAELGTRTFAIDVEMGAVGTVQGYGYDIAPQHARLVAWWSDLTTLDSKSERTTW